MLSRCTESGFPDEQLRSGRKVKQSHAHLVDKDLNWVGKGRQERGETARIAHSTNMERADEASELASLAGSADSEANRPLPSYSEGPQQPVSPPPSATGSVATSGSPAPPQDSNSHHAKPGKQWSNVPRSWVLMLRNSLAGVVRKVKWKGVPLGI